MGVGGGCLFGVSVSEWCVCVFFLVRVCGSVGGGYLTVLVCVCVDIVEGNLKAVMTLATSLALCVCV